MFNLILFGPPGSGKGTQAVQLAEKFSFVHISTGDLFRYEMGNNTRLGQKAKEYISKGELVPDEITVGMLKNKMESIEDTKGFILDGFPRTIPQANALDELLKSKGQKIDALISLDVPDDEIVARLLNRGKTSGRSDDADVDIIRNRIAVYKNETSPVYDHYEKVGSSQTIEGLGTIEEIFERLSDSISASMEQ